MGVVAGALAIAVVIAGSVFLIRAERYARRPAPAEHGQTPVYTEQAGALFGRLRGITGISWTIPFVRVATFPDSVVISCVTHEIVLRRGDVIAIEEDRAFLGVGLRLEHERMDVPSIVLWSSSRIRLERALRASLLGQTTETPRGIDADAQPGFFRAAAVHWRSFAPAWVFPVFFFYGAGIADAAGYGEPFFVFIAAPVFFWSFFRATRPVREGLLAYGPYVFWGMFVPFLIGGAVVSSHLLE